MNNSNISAIDIISRPNKYILSAVNNHDTKQYTYFENIYFENKYVNISEEQMTELLEKIIQTSLNAAAINIMRYILVDSPFHEKYQELFLKNRKGIYFCALIEDCSKSVQPSENGNLSIGDTGLEILNILLEKQLMPEVQLINLLVCYGGYKKSIREKMYALVMPYFDEIEYNLIYTMRDSVEIQNHHIFQSCLEAMPYSTIKSQDIKKSLLAYEDKMKGLFPLQEYLLALAAKEKKEIEGVIGLSDNPVSQKVFKL